MSRDLAAIGLGVVAYAAAIAGMLTFEGILDRSMSADVAIVTWAAALAGSMLANWKRGLWVLPSTMFVLAMPLAFLIVFSNMALD